MFPLNLQPLHQNQSMEDCSPDKKVFTEKKLSINGIHVDIGIP